jgi:acyl carrier protein
MTIEAQLTQVFREVFEDDQIALARTATANDIDGWDSLSHVTLLMAVEDHFQIEFGQYEVSRLSNVGALIDLISAKLQ